MTSERPTARSARSARSATIWPIALDALVVLAFTLGGADAHERGLSDLGRIAWPFAAALVLVWLLPAVHRAPLRLWPAGALVWVGTTAVGLALRALAGGGTAWTFVAVSAGLFAAGLLGWRLVALVVERLRSSGRRSG